MESDNDHDQSNEISQVDLAKVGEFTYGPSNVSIIDSVADYLTLLQSIFDFELIKKFLFSRSSEFRVLFDGLHGVTGPYAQAIFVSALGLPPASVQNCVPLPDFGGGHPDPNLTYAHSLVEAVETNGIEFGAASDGDGDRNMIYGKGAFVTPSDSVAIIAHWADVIPYFKQQGGVKGLARSMPTSKAIDLVAKKKGVEYFEVPTGIQLYLLASRSHDTHIRGIQDGSSLEILWMLEDYLSAVKNHLELARTTFARRTVCGLLSVRTVQPFILVVR